MIRTQTSPTSLLHRTCSCSALTPIGSSICGPVSSPPSLLNCTMSLRSSGVSWTGCLR
jgi:hypothetical protein